MARKNNNGEKGMDGVEKAAILLIALGPEKSAEIFKHLKEEEIEQLTLEIANTNSVKSFLRNLLVKKKQKLLLESLQQAFRFVLSNSSEGQIHRSCLTLYRMNILRL